MIVDLQERHQAEINAAVDEAVKAAVAAILRRYYGPRSEKFDPRQLLLFGQRLDTAHLDTVSIEDESGEELSTRRVKNRDKHGRQQLPEHLERIEIEHDLDDKACPACGCERCRIGAEVSEQLEYFPASFKVLKHIRHKYACTKCDHDGYDPNIQAAKKPAQPIEKGLPGPSLLAYVITSKLGDHLPLYRLERIFERQKVHVARSTMCAWMRCAGELVGPLVDLMTGRIRPVEGDSHRRYPGFPFNRRGRSSVARAASGATWAMRRTRTPSTITRPAAPAMAPPSGSPVTRATCKQTPTAVTTASFIRQNVTEVACWAHARRKFYDAQDSDEERATQMLALIGQLYQIERESKDLSDPLRVAVRQERSVSILAKIKTWLDREQEVVLPPQPDGHGHHLRPEPVAGAHHVRHPRLPQYRQQRQRTGSQAGRPGPKKLVICGKRRRGREPCPTLEPDRQLRTASGRSTTVPHQRAGQDRPDVGR